MRTLIVTLCCCIGVLAVQAKDLTEQARKDALDAVNRALEKVQGEVGGENNALNSAKRALEEAQGELGDLQKQIREYQIPGATDIEGIDDGIAVAADPSIDPGIVHLLDQDGTPLRTNAGSTDHYFQNWSWNEPDHVLEGNVTGSDLKSLPQQDMTIPADSFAVIPGIHIPKITIRGMRTPDITIPEITVPDMTVPEITVPDIDIPEQHIEGITVPKMHVPGITVPEKHIKGMKIPKRHIKGMEIPEIIIPQLDIPEIKDRNKIKTVPERVSPPELPDMPQQDGNK